MYRQTTARMIVGQHICHTEQKKNKPHNKSSYTRKYCCHYYIFVVCAANQPSHSNETHTQKKRIETIFCIPYFSSFDFGCVLLVLFACFEYCETSNSVWIAVFSINERWASFSRLWYIVSCFAQRNLLNLKLSWWTACVCVCVLLLSRHCGLMWFLWFFRLCNRSAISLPRRQIDYVYSCSTDE